VDTTESISGASLVNGRKYLVLYAISYGGNDTTSESEVIVLHGSTVIARGRDENNYGGSPSPTSMSGYNLCGSYVITGDGANGLKIQYRTDRTADTAYIKGSTLIAIPLNDLTENTDYFYAQQNGDAAAATTTNSIVAVLTDTFTLQEAGDYLVLASCEGTMSSGGGSTEGWGMGFSITGVGAQKQEMFREWEDHDASISFSYARVHTLSSGDKTLSVWGDYGQGTTAVREFRRGRIFLFNLSSFDQTVDSFDDTETEVSSSYDTWTDLITHTDYTPAQTEYVLVIGNVFGRHTHTGRRAVMARIQNTTDATEFCDFSSGTNHDENFDRLTLTPIGCEQLTGLVPKTYKLQVSGQSAATSSCYFKHADLIILSLTTVAAAGTYAKTFTETAKHTDTKERQLTMNRTHTEGFQRSLVIDTPSGPVRYVDAADGSDSYDGTAATAQGSGVGPWKTLDYAADQIAAGTTVYVANGNYKGFQALSLIGTSSGWTEFVASGSNVVIDEQSDIGGSEYYPAVSVKFCEYFRIKGFKIDGTNFTFNMGAASTHKGEGMKIRGGAHVDVEDCTIYNTPRNAVKSTDCNYTRTIDCTFYGVAWGDDGHTIYYAGTDPGYN
jgi:hypothetical protein